MSAHERHFHPPVILRESLDGGTRELRISGALREFSTHLAVYLDGSGNGLGLVLTPEQAEQAIEVLQATVKRHWEEKSAEERES